MSAGREARGGRESASGDRQLSASLDEAMARWEKALPGAISSRPRGCSSSASADWARPAWAGGASGASLPRPLPIPIPTFSSSTRGWLCTRTAARPFYVGKTDGGQGTGTATQQMMCDELDIAFDRATVVMGRTDMTVDQGGSGGLGRDRARRHGRTPDRGGGEAGAAGDGVGALRRARRGACSERRRNLARGRSLADGRLRRADRWTALRCRAGRGQHQLDHRCRERQAGPGPEAGRPVDSALRHSRQGRWVARVGRRRQAAGHGSRPKCAPALRRGDARRPSTSHRCATCPASSGS